jgi:hypothetical protein
MIRFLCECGRQLEVPDGNAVKKARCPQCERVMTVPGTTGGAGAIQVERSQGDGEPGEGIQTGRNPDLGLPALADIKGRVSGGKGTTVSGLVVTILVLSLMSLLLLALLLPASRRRVPGASDRTRSMNNLKQMALAMQTYHDDMDRFPQSGTGPSQGPILDKKQKPLLSWRVAILPYIEAGNLYSQFRQDEPWDSPHNIQLLPRMPRVYALPGEVNPQSGMTHYQGFVGPGAFFEPGKVLRIVDITDGTASTLMIVEAADAVPWTKPEDLNYDPEGPLPPLGGHFRGGFNAVFADGWARFLSDRTPQATLRAMITRNGGESFTLP